MAAEDIVPQWARDWKTTMLAEMKELFASSSQGSARVFATKSEKDRHEMWRIEKGQEVPICLTVHALHLLRPILCTSLHIQYLSADLELISSPGGLGQASWSA